MDQMFVRLHNSHNSHNCTHGNIASVQAAVVLARPSMKLREPQGTQFKGLVHDCMVVHGMSMRMHLHVPLPFEVCRRVFHNYAGMHPIIRWHASHCMASVCQLGHLIPRCHAIVTLQCQCSTIVASQCNGIICPHFSGLA